MAEEAQAMIRTGVWPRPGLSWLGKGASPRRPCLLLGGGGPPAAGAIAVLVDHTGDELGREGNNHAIGDDGQHSDGLEHLQPRPWVEAAVSCQLLQTTVGWLAGGDTDSGHPSPADRLGGVVPSTLASALPWTSILEPASHLPLAPMSLIDPHPS